MRASILTFKRARTLRRKMTLPEDLLWQELRGARLNGLRFRRQHPVGPYILDFLCPASRLAVEVDGKLHDHPVQIQRDQRREEWLAEKRIKVLRIGAGDILREGNLESVLAFIARAADPSTVDDEPPPPLRFACGPPPP